MGKSIIGIDIRAEKLTAVVLKTSVKGAWIEAHVQQGLNGAKDPQSNLIQALNALRNELKSSINSHQAICTVALPSHLISLRNIQVPFRENKKIQQMLPYELETALPYAIDDVIIDYQVVDVTDSAHLMTASMQKDMLKAYLDAMESQQLIPSAFTAGVFPTALCLTHLTDLPQNWIMLDLEASRHTFIVVHAGQIYLMRSFPPPARSTSKVKWFTNNIRRTLLACEDLFSLDFQPACIVLTGSESVDPQFCEEIGRQLNLPVQKCNLARDLNINLPPTDKEWQPERMDAALALTALELNGIEGLNFRRGALSSKNHWRTYAKGLIMAGTLAALLMIMTAVTLIIDNQRLNNRVAQLDTAIEKIFRSAFPEVKRIVDPLHQMQVKLTSLKNEPSMQIDQATNIKRIDILNQISQSIPQQINTRLSRLVITQESVLISGNTGTFNAVDEMKNRLEKINLFQNVTISSANMDKTGKRVRFKLKILLQSNP